MMMNRKEELLPLAPLPLLAPLAPPACPVEKDTQKMLYIEGPKYVSFDNKMLNLEVFVHILITTIAISHFFVWEKRLL